MTAVVSGAAVVSGPRAALIDVNAFSPSPTHRIPSRRHRHHWPSPFWLLYARVTTELKRVRELVVGIWLHTHTHTHTHIAVSWAFGPPLPAVNKATAGATEALRSLAYLELGGDNGSSVYVCVCVGRERERERGNAERSRLRARSAGSVGLTCM